MYFSQCMAYELTGFVLRKIARCCCCCWLFVGYVYGVFVNTCSTKDPCSNTMQLQNHHAQPSQLVTPQTNPTLPQTRGKRNDILAAERLIMRKLKTAFLFQRRNRITRRMILNDIPIDTKNTIKILGITLDSNLK